MYGGVEEAGDEGPGPDEPDPPDPSRSASFSERARMMARSLADAAHLQRQQPREHPEQQNYVDHNHHHHPAAVEGI